MRKIKRLRSLFHWKKHIDPVNEFLTKILPAVEALEKEGKLLVSSTEPAGIVLNNELANYFQMCYVTRMAHYTKQYGLERYINARYWISGFARKHNPDEELLNLCQNARMVINFRRAAYVSHGYIEEVKNEELRVKNTDYNPSALELRNNEPLYITYMNADLSVATHAGYETNGEITLKVVGGK